MAYNVNLFGSLTHYASGQAAVSKRSQKALRLLLCILRACAVYVNNLHAELGICKPSCLSLRTMLACPVMSPSVRVQVYFGAGYLKTEDVFLQGAACAVANLLLWGSVGMLWWKVLGWY
jgi:hypothetical protein